MDIINRIAKNFKDLFNNKKREFAFLATKTAFIFLYWFGITLPLLRGNSINGNVLQVIVLGTWIFLIFLLGFLVYPVLELAEIKIAKKLYKIMNIIMIVSTAWIFLTYIIAKSDIPNLALVFGFWLALLSCVATAILTWKQNLIMNLVYKVFKIPETHVEPVKEAPQPEPVPTPEPVVEPAPVPEPEPVPEPKDVEEVEEELEEIVEEETKIEETEQVIESLKEKE